MKPEWLPKHKYLCFFKDHLVMWPQLTCRSNQAGKQISGFLSAILLVILLKIDFIEEINFKRWAIFESVWEKNCYFNAVWIAFQTF